MKIDFTKRLLGLTGVPLKTSTAPDAEEATLETVAATGLLAPLPNGSPKQAADSFRLALRISNSVRDGVACEIDAAESTLIKEGVGRAYGNQPGVCGPVELLLEGDAIVKDLN